mgnify:CR=1 FL=1
MSHDDIQHALAIQEEIQHFIRHVTTLLSEGRDDEAARQALRLRDEFTARGESYAAATVSSLAATFLGRAGEQMAAVDAARRAVALHPDPYFLIQLAKRQTKGGDLSLAIDALEELLATPGLPPSTEHAALSAIAGILATSGRYEEASAMLERSREVAVDRSLPATSWNMSVVVDLAMKSVCMPEVSAYLASLLDCARRDGAQFIADEVVRMIGKST